MRAGGLPNRSPIRNGPWRPAVALSVALWSFACGSRSGLAPGQVLDAASGRGGSVASSAGSAGQAVGGSSTATGGSTTGGTAVAGTVNGGVGGAQNQSGNAGVAGNGGVTGGSDAVGGEGGSGGEGGQMECPRGTQGPTCEPIVVTQMALGSVHLCALLSDGTVRCWGGNWRAQLGNGKLSGFEPDLLPIAEHQPVSITTTPGVRVTKLAAGSDHTCALLSDDSVKCWGANAYGQLGYGNTNMVGDDELPSSVGAVSVTTTPGVRPVDLAAGDGHTCALLSDGKVTCWGKNQQGELGYGRTDQIGDDELPSSVGTVSVSNDPAETVVGLALGYAHTCARLSGGGVKCWGNNGQGQLGYPGQSLIGDDELPSSVANVSVSAQPGVTTLELTAGTFTTCARLSSDEVKCWGHNEFGELGRGDTRPIGDDEEPSSVSGAALASSAGAVVGVASGSYHSCALFAQSLVQCWGVNQSGQLGYALPLTYIGDDEPLPPPYSPANVPGVTVTSLSAGGGNTCVIFSDGSAKCWGFGLYGQNGYGNTQSVGGTESPSSLGTIEFF